MARRYSIKMCHSWCGVTNTYRLHKIVRRESPVKNRADNDIVILIPLPIVHKIVMDTPDFFILLFGCRKNETIYCTIHHVDEICWRRSDGSAMRWPDNIIWHQYLITLKH